MSGALAGLRVVEFGGIGPAPFCGMMLADHGAEVIRIDRPGTSDDPFDVLARSRRRIVLDLGQEDGVALARELCRASDGLIEGYRPGVMEKLGLGPETLIADNPALVYGRMTGWGQEGPLARTAGHDINYIALTGVLHTVGAAGGKPVPPVNYIGDFGGGGMMLAFGMVTALLAVARGGKGQVVDAAMTDGSAILSSMVWQLHGRGEWSAQQGTNILDGGAHFYDTYICADGRYIAVGAIEPRFYEAMREALGLTADRAFDVQKDPAAWPALKARLAAVFVTRTRDQWCAILEGVDACVTPVLTLDEASLHPHNAERSTFLDVGGQIQPGPAPRFAGTAAPLPVRAKPPGFDSDELLAELGIAPDRIASLRARGTVA